MLNAAVVAGAAAAASELIEANGFTVTEVGNADGESLERTRILHPPAFAEAAGTLATLLPGADVIEGVDGLPLTVKLGADVKPAALRSLAAASEAPAGSRASRAAATRGDATEKEAAPATEPTYRGAELTDVDC